MRYAVIKDSTVSNVILANQKSDYSLHPGEQVIQSDIANIGDTWDGAKFISSPPPVPLPDWVTFNNSLLIDSPYNRVAASTTNQQSKNRLESYAISLGVSNNITVNYLVFQLLWNQMIDGVPLIGKPVPQEIEGWRAIAHSAFMPFDFAADGKIVLN